MGSYSSIPSAANSSSSSPTGFSTKSSGPTGSSSSSVFFCWLSMLSRISLRLRLCSNSGSSSLSGSKIASIISSSVITFEITGSSSSMIAPALFSVFTVFTNGRASSALSFGVNSLLSQGIKPLKVITKIRNNNKKSSIAAPIVPIIAPSQPERINP